MAKLLVGQLLRAKTTFSSTPTKPYVLFDPQGGSLFKFKDPKGGASSVAGTRDSLGMFEARVPLTLAGTWWFRSEGHDAEGNVIAVDEGPFEVSPSHF